MAAQWTMWRELTCLSSLELKTLCILEPATKPGTFVGRDQGLGGCWWHKYCCAFNCWKTKCRTWFVREDGKSIQKFLKSPENKTKQKKNHKQPADSYRISTNFPNSFSLGVIGLGTEKKSVSKRIIFTQAEVMVLGQKLMGEILWPLWYKRLDKAITIVPLAF